MKKKILILIGLAISSITSCAPNPESYDVVTVSYCPVYDIVCDDDYSATLTGEYAQDAIDIYRYIRDTDSIKKYDLTNRGVDVHNRFFFTFESKDLKNWLEVEANKINGVYKIGEIRLLVSRNKSGFFKKAFGIGPFPPSEIIEPCKNLIQYIDNLLDLPDTMIY